MTTNGRTRRSRRLAQRYWLDLGGLDKRQQRRAVRRIGSRQNAKAELFRVLYGGRRNGKLYKRAQILGSTTGRFPRPPEPQSLAPSAGLFFTDLMRDYAELDAKVTMAIYEANPEWSDLRRAADFETIGFPVLPERPLFVTGIS